MLLRLHVLVWSSWESTVFWPYFHCSVSHIRPVFEHSYSADQWQSTMLYNTVSFTDIIVHWHHNIMHAAYLILCMGNVIFILQVNQLFDNGGTVFFAIIMSFWGEMISCMNIIQGGLITYSTCIVSMFCACNLWKNIYMYAYMVLMKAKLARNSFYC